MSDNLQNYGLLMAILDGNVNKVTEQLKKPENDILAVDQMGNTPLQWAEFLGKDKVAKIIREHIQEQKKDIQHDNKPAKTDDKQPVGKNSNEKLVQKGDVPKQKTWAASVISKPKVSLTEEQRSR